MRIMAKKKLLKKLKIDWKFVALLFGILLVSLSVFVLNQKVTYKSSAYSGCGPAYEQCKEECRSQPNGGWAPVPDDSHPDGNAMHNVCVNHCRRAKEECQQPPAQNQQQTQQTPPTQQGARTKTTTTTDTCTRFVNLETCNNNCGNNNWCLQICSFLATICQ